MFFRFVPSQGVNPPKKKHKIKTTRRTKTAHVPQEMSNTGPFGSVKFKDPGIELAGLKDHLEDHPRTGTVVIVTPQDLRLWGPIPNGLFMGLYNGG